MKIGLIGYGFMGRAHAAAIQSLPGVALYALACRTHPSDDEHRRGNLDLKTAPLPDSVKWTPDWREVVTDSTIDAVDICLPTHLHKPVALAALEHGKHVLCEKPMALNTSECDELMAVAANATKTFMIAQVLRFRYPYIYALGFIRAAGIDDIVSCTLQRSTGYPQWSNWLANSDCSGGAILDLLSHDLDLALLWFGPPDAVSAVSVGDVDTAEATLRYGTRNVIVTRGWLTPEAPFSESFRIETVDSTLNYDGAALTLTHGGNSETVEMPEHDAYADEIAYFVNCAKTGVSPHRCPPEDSARVVRLAEVLKRSREERGHEALWESSPSGYGLVS
jgi:predicted dehydrogenase